MLLNYFLWKVMRYVTFALLFKYEQGLILFLIEEVLFIANVKGLSHPKV